MTDLTATIEELSNRWMQAWVRNDSAKLNSTRG